MTSLRKQFSLSDILGWLAVGISTALAAFWAFWGSIENFHEGWYAHSIWENLALMLGQYLGFSILFIVLALTGIHRAKFGGILHLLFGGSLAWALRASGAGLLLSLPIIGIGMLYYFGHVQSRRVAIWIVIGVPLLTAIGFGIGPAYQTFTRTDDGYRGARLLTANGVKLVWASEGPGWANSGVNWYDAQKACAHLSEDGLSIVDSAINIWRLPTAEEMVRSGYRHGLNVGATLDTTTMTPSYDIRPDKETPLFDRYSMIIYWWSGTEADTSSAYLYSFNGHVFKKNKKFAAGNYGFRAVRNPVPGDSLLPGAMVVPK